MRTDTPHFGVRTITLPNDMSLITLYRYYRTGTTKSDNVYKHHAAFGKRYELLMTSIAVMKKHKLKNHEAPAYISACSYAK